jgi:hypothetical protein
MLPVLPEGGEDCVGGRLTGEGEGDGAPELVGAEPRLGDRGEDGGAMDDLGLDSFLRGLEEEADVGCSGEGVPPDENPDVLVLGLLDETRGVFFESAPRELFYRLPDSLREALGVGVEDHGVELCVEGVAVSGGLDGALAEVGVVCEADAD